MQGDLLKKLPTFGIINFWTAKQNNLCEENIHRDCSIAKKICGRSFVNKFVVLAEVFIIRPCETGKFSLRPYRIDYGN